MSAASSRPLALLVVPPVYDFAFYDLFLKPFALLRLGGWLAACGYRVRLVNALDYRDGPSCARLGRPRRRPDGTGQLFRQAVDRPPAFGAGTPPVPRRFARYGILPCSLERRLAGEGPAGEEPAGQRTEPWMATCGWKAALACSESQGWRERPEPPDVVLVSSGMTYWYPGVVEAIRMSRRLFPKAPVVLGGVYATLCPDHAARVCGPDFLVAGEAFPALPRILAGLGLPHRPEGGGEADEPLLLPQMLPEAGAIRLNRGCPFDCTYCASRRLEGAFRPGDPQAAFRIVRRMNERFGTRHFAFYDDALLAGREEVLVPFLERVLGSGLQVAFHAPNGLHLRFLEPETARLMRRAGFREIRLGFESGRADFHRASGRKLEVEMLEEAAQALRAAGFRPEEASVYVLAGLPGQHWTEVEESIRHAAARGFRVRLAEYSPVPGTALWAESCRLSPFPLAEEPLTHNNSIFPLRWAGFTLERLQAMKDLARDLARALVRGSSRVNRAG